MPDKITVTYSDITNRTITNLFLYGQIVPPAYADRLQPSILPEPVIEMDLDLDPTYFTDGPGKFAYAARNGLVKSLFTGGDVFGRLPYGQFYTVADLKAHGVTDTDLRFAFRQVQTKIGEDDYTSRTYIYNSQAYQLSDDVVFYSDKDKSYVLNLAVKPRNEDFDFVTGDPITTSIEQVLLQNMIDPYSIHKKVLMEYAGSGGYYENDLSVRYTIENYNNEIEKITTETTNYPASLVSAAFYLLGMAQGLPSTDYYHNDGRVIYGSNAADVIDSSYILNHNAKYEAAIYLGGGGDVIVAGEGNDGIWDGSGNDTDYGGAGWDSFIFSSGNDTFFGGDGIDLADFSGFGSSIFGGPISVHIGEEVLLPGDVGYVLAGSNKIKLNSIENITGTSQNDEFLLTSAAADMFLDGGDGQDNLIISSGFSGVTIYDTGENIILDGHIVSYRNFEFVRGTIFNDHIFINQGGKIIKSDAGDDTIYVENYTLNLTGESIDGGAGNNVLVTGDYADITGATLTHIPTLTINGNYGAVTMSVAQLNGFSAINAVAGNALIFLSTGGSYNLGNLTVTGNVMIQGMTTDPVTVTGSSGNDTLSGWSSSNTTLYGMAGNDTLIAGEGQNHLYGGDGDDYFVLSGITTVGDVLDGNAGYNTLDATNHTDLSVLTLRNIQKLEIENGDVGLTAAQFNLLTTFMAYGGVATLIAKSSGTYDLSGKTTAGRINVRGSAGVDILVGDAKGQTLNGGAGIDQLTGNGGADVFKFGSLTDSRYSGGMDRIADFTIGTDKIDVTGLGFTGITTGTPGAGQLKVAYDSYYNQTYVYHAASGFGFYMSGNKAAITTADFIGLNIPATVTINGTSGNDYLSGGSTNDLILGMGAQDQLLGNDGNDTLDGGAGVDQLTGGAGLDVFRFTSLADSVFGSAMDRIADFTKGEDKIDLTGLGFTGVTTGTPAAGQLKLTYDAFYQQTYLRDMGGSGFGVYLSGNHMDIANSDIIGLVPSS